MRRDRLRGDRAAGLVEYALIMALFVTASMGSFEFLNDRAEDNIVDTSGKIGSLPSQVVQDESPSSSTTSTTMAPTTTTTAGPTTTTTAAPTTTTTAPPTTTTTAAPSERSQGVSDTESSTMTGGGSRRGGQRPYWLALVRVTVQDNTGRAMSGSIVSGSWGNTDRVYAAACRTNRNGQCWLYALRWGSGSFQDWSVSGIVGNGVPWDGRGVRVRVAGP